VLQAVKKPLLPLSLHSSTSSPEIGKLSPIESPKHSPKSSEGGGGGVNQTALAFMIDTSVLQFPPPLPKPLLPPIPSGSASVSDHLAGSAETSPLNLSDSNGGLNLGLSGGMICFLTLISVL
jgi:hypothetical protein